MGTLRLLLAISVAIGHSYGVFGHKILSGITAVQAFYIISGFLITMILNENPRYGHILSFYKSRYLRIWPPYLLVFIISNIVSGGLKISWAFQIFDIPSFLFMLFTNIFIFFQDLTLLMTTESRHIVFTSRGIADLPPPLVVGFLSLPQCWSLGVELTFYALAPLVCRRWWRLMILFAAGLVSRILTAQLFDPGSDPWLYRFSPSEMMMFAGGGLAYVAAKAIRLETFRATCKFLAYAIMPTVSAIIVLDEVVNPFVVAREWNYSTYLYIQDPWFLAIIVFICPILFYASARFRWDSLLGELSYPVYLVHVTVGEFVFSKFSSDMQFYGLSYLLITIVAAFLVLYGVVLPFDKIRSRFGARIPQFFTT